MSELPKGWKQVEIGDVSKVVSGGTPQASISENFCEPSDGGHAWLTPADLSGYKPKMISHGKRNITEKGLKESSAKLMPEGSILFSSRAPIGYVAIAENEIATNQGFKSFVFTDEVVPSYAYYYLKSIRGLAESWGTGTTFKELSSAKAKKLPFVYPSIEEQKRIADKLDSVLAKVEAAQARLDKIPAILKRFRQSVLAAATSGELTRDWRENNEIHEDWNVHTLNELSLSIRSGSGKKPTDLEGGIPILRSSAVRALDIDYLDYRTIEENSLTERDYIQNGDLLFTRLSGSKEYVGNCSKVENIRSRIAYPDRLFKVELNDSELADYIALYCSSPSYFKYIEQSIKSSAGHQRITTEVIKNIEIKLPKKNEREKIVDSVNLLFEKANRIEKRYLKSKSKIDSLEQSILSKAFSGKLS